ncbi:hypothetical protein GCM10009119_28260 [Algoriphagus jejuensis]|uniref:Lipocalin-like protein n=1 Tax=Algoriphagus jejuensis TaxID=419934 RepID=A0ABP3YIG0_9BACT
MKHLVCALSLAAITLACSPPTQNEQVPEAGPSLVGTWKLISGTTIRGNDTTITDYTRNQEFIKIINKTHFSFISHDLNKGQDSTAMFSAGAGKYTLNDDTYIEQLDYFNHRDWEGHQFEFTVSIEQDTLIQTGLEAIPELGVDQTIIEKYVRVK